MGSKGKKDSLYSLSREFLGTELEYERYKMAMLGESHRSSALMASAFVEHLLLAMIRAKLIPLDEAEDNALFLRPGATLGTFADRTDIAYALGLIHDRQRSDLNVIRDIRNVFAHAVKDIDFHHPLIKRECEKFGDGYQISEDNRGDETRSLYINVCHRLTIDFSDKALDFQSRKSANAANGTDE